MTSTSEDRWRDLRPDPENDTPLYLQLARKLNHAIHSNRWQAGEALPSERLLSEALGVSRITARNAVALLVEQGLIRRTQGAGSFITPRYEDPLSRLSSFSQMLRRRGFTPSSKWLSHEVRPANRDEVIQLGLSPGAQVIHLRRLRLADGIVMAVENSTFPAALIPVPKTIGDSLYSYLDQHGLSIVRALQHFRAVNATAEIAQQMNIAPNDALLLITRVGYTVDQRAIELTDTYCRNDYYDFVIELRS
ncbi:GntR family transcriptional regulator [Paraburkholderia bonniea]|uniref:GntR family transcriptional regulator n=1 Tax=Paraburkholderia bonniea TaxID=2152891 RepID=UPI00129097E8|nr:GntR family transcriptional regulator [Paraburkholderia bonniea]WJF89646.1 GntR family transcriptional regulator [Paraburkholderia bonniea]WJF92960.1 GntR family transcriptional regulator [Paraburkholderia bonniea]